MNEKRKKASHQKSKKLCSESSGNSHTTLNPSSRPLRKEKGYKM